MMTGRWLPTLLTCAVVARILVLFSQAWMADGRITRLSEDTDYRVVGVPDAVHLLLHPVSSPGQTVTVRLLAIEPAAPPPSPAGHQASTELAGWVLNRIVTLQLDRRQIDDDGHLLAYVFYQDVCINERLVQSGHCRVAAQPCDYATMVRRLRNAEAAARASRRDAGPSTDSWE